MPMAPAELTEKARRLLASTLLLAVGAAWLVGAAVLGWQVLQWLRTSVWHEVPFLQFFVHVGIDMSAAYSPTSWQGLAKIARWILDLPLSTALPIAVTGAAGGIASTLNLSLE